MSDKMVAFHSSALKSHTTTIDAPILAWSSSVRLFLPAPIAVDLEVPDGPGLVSVTGVSGGRLASGASDDMTELVEDGPDVRLGG
jgi:hypothetical protein